MGDSLFAGGAAPGGTVAGGITRTHAQKRSLAGTRGLWPLLEGEVGARRVFGGVMFI